MSSECIVCSQWLENVLLATVAGTPMAVWLVAVILVSGRLGAVLPVTVLPVAV